MHHVKEREKIPTGRADTRITNVGIIRSGKARNWAITLVFVVTALTAVMITFAETRDGAHAQSQLPPTLPAVIFSGWVTVNGSPIGVQGLSLTAKVGDWISEPVTIGEGTPDANGFEDLTVNPPIELVGGEINFVLGGTVQSTVNSYYALIEPDGSFCLTCVFSFPDFREINIDFPSLPETPAQPTAPPDQPIQPGEPAVTIFSGQAFTSAGLVPDGYQIFAVVGDAMRSNNVTVLDGTYNLAINTADSNLDGVSVTFYLIDKGDPTNPNKTLQAETPSVFTTGQQTEVRLFFPALAPTATPEPTATPIPPTATPVPPTATPEPTATPVPPTATPVPPTATPIPPTATPVPPTATPEPEETEGGFNATVPLAIILVLVLLGIAGYFGWQYSRRSAQDA